MNRKSIVTVVLLAGAATAIAQERLPRIPPEQYTPEQKQAAAEFEAARRAPVFGPFEPLMNSPELMSRSRAMGDYLRYASAIGNSLSELVILMTAREWNQDYEWSVHYPVALKAGMRQEVADAVGSGQRPKSMTVDEMIVFDYTDELLKNKRVSDATFARAQSRFGNKGVVDMTGIAGYYTLLAMQLNVAQYQPPAEAAKLPRLAH
jgi:4-carboxymuconolactone decarboxylase